MPLTPADVQAKLFKVVMRGYDRDEVDVFLDEVEAEIGRLLRENGDLREKAERAPAPEPLERPLSGTEGQEAALRTLLLAQRTADEAVAEARAEAEQIVSAARAEADTTLTDARAEAERAVTEARAEAERAVTEARAEAERTLSEARAEADRTLTDARAEAERSVTQAREEAEATLGSARTEAEQTLGSARSEAETTLTSARDEAQTTLTSAREEAQQTLAAAREEAERSRNEVEAARAAALGDLDGQRTSLEQRLEDLTGFEREYRTRLRAYLSNLLADLDGDGAPAAADRETAPVR